MRCTWRQTFDDPTEDDYEMSEDQSDPEMDDDERETDPDEMLDKRFEQFEEAIWK